MTDAYSKTHLPKELAFSEAEYARRLSHVRAAMAKAGLDIMLVHQLPNVCYLTGYQTSLCDWYVCLVIPAEGEVSFQICDRGMAALHTTMSRMETVRWDKMGAAAEQLVGTLKSYHPDGKRIGIELRRPGLTPHTYQALLAGYPNAKFVDATELVARIRAVKSPAEIECLRQAGRFSVAGVDAAIAAMRPGITDNEIAAVGSAAMIRAGSEYYSIDPFVRTGHRTSINHSSYKRFMVKAGDPVILEFGAVYQRYTAPLYATIVAGRPSDRVRRFADICLRAIDLLYENIRPGRTMNEVARAASKGLEGIEPDLELSERHAYSVGLGFPPDWVEHSLYIAEGYEEVLAPGMVFHTPRSLRDIGRFGTAFSETILVTETGYEILTPHRRELIVV